MFRVGWKLSILYWVGIAVVTCILMTVLLSFAYVGPEDTFFGLMVDIYKTIVVSTAILGCGTEALAWTYKKMHNKDDP